MPEGQAEIISSLRAEIRQWRQDERVESATAHAENRTEMEALRREMLALSASVKMAFPGGDFDGHRRYHELLIAREEQRQQIRREVITHLLKGSTWAALVGLLWMVLRHAKDYLK
ncbi:hypothetical protein ACLQ9R_01520 [Bordetella hinzii]|uniref:hypothetical protein n=1 Tax=Bordetella hinzii TaxID=103855 RepID=UPI00115312E2|nr:hypothetical protein [Bordetella hinzii]MCJ9707674.1 hypothetical protein [Bordetella hinzii]